ncbi:hypothetical protein CF319_g5893 [Tilletia indica]|nr:hypothetical protein CF319_g5893 [Tilletia indica]
MGLLPGSAVSLLPLKRLLHVIVTSCERDRSHFDSLSLAVTDLCKLNDSELQAQLIDFRTDLFSAVAVLQQRYAQPTKLLDEPDLRRANETLTARYQVWTALGVDPTTVTPGSEGTPFEKDETSIRDQFLHQYAPSDQIPEKTTIGFIQATSSFNTPYQYPPPDHTVTKPGQSMPDKTTNGSMLATSAFNNTFKYPPPDHTATNPGQNVPDETTIGFIQATSSFNTPYQYPPPDHTVTKPGQSMPDETTNGSMLATSAFNNTFKYPPPDHTATNPGQNVPDETTIGFIQATSSFNTPYQYPPPDHTVTKPGQSMPDETTNISIMATSAFNNTFQNPPPDHTVTMPGQNVPDETTNGSMLATSAFNIPFQYPPPDRTVMNPVQSVPDETASKSIQATSSHDSQPPHDTAMNPGQSMPDEITNGSMLATSAFNNPFQYPPPDHTVTIPGQNVPVEAASESIQATSSHDRLRQIVPQSRTNTSTKSEPRLPASRSTWDPIQVKRRAELTRRLASTKYEEFKQKIFLEDQVQSEPPEHVCPYTRIFVAKLEALGSVAIANLYNLLKLDSTLDEVHGQCLAHYSSLKDQTTTSQGRRVSYEMLANASADVPVEIFYDDTDQPCVRLPACTRLTLKRYYCIKQLALRWHWAAKCLRFI